MLSHQILNEQSPTWYVDRTLALYRYFQLLGTLPNPSGPLSAHVSPAVIKEANEAVRNASQASSKPRGKYAKFTPEQKASIGKYASLHGNLMAIRHYLKQSGVNRKFTSGQTSEVKDLSYSVVKLGGVTLSTLMHTYKNKNKKIISTGLMAIYTKLCTFQNLMLCGIVPVHFMKYDITANRIAIHSK